MLSCRKVPIAVKDGGEGAVELVRTYILNRKVQGKVTPVKDEGEGAVELVRTYILNRKVQGKVTLE